MSADAVALAWIKWEARNIERSGRLEWNGAAWTWHRVTPSEATRLAHARLLRGDGPPASVTTTPGTPT